MTNNPIHVPMTIGSSQQAVPLTVEPLTITQNISVDARTEVSTDYNKLRNKPQINTVELIGNRSLDEIGVQSLTNIEIENMLR